MKLWNKQQTAPLEKQIEHFTVGNDRELDMILMPYDLLASKAHAQMLGASGLISTKEADELIAELNVLQKEYEAGELTIEDAFEDMHSKIEYELTQRLGEVGKKIHKLYL